MDALLVVGSWWSDHPDLEAVARRGRTELEEETAAAERDTELLRQRRRSIIDVCYEWMTRGDLITIGVADRQFEGQLVDAVNDLLALETGTTLIAVNAHAVRFVRSDHRGASAGTTGKRSARSFRAALGRYEIDGTLVRLLGRHPGLDLTGVIAASTEDHVLLRDGQGSEWVLPRTAIACAVAEPRQQGRTR